MKGPLEQFWHKVEKCTFKHIKMFTNAHVFANKELQEARSKTTQALQRMINELFVIYNNGTIY